MLKKYSIALLLASGFLYGMQQDDASWASLQVDPIQKYAQEILKSDVQLSNCMKNGCNVHGKQEDQLKDELVRSNEIGWWVQKVIRKNIASPNELPIKANLASLVVHPKKPQCAFTTWIPEGSTKGTAEVWSLDGICERRWEPDSNVRNSKEMFFALSYHPDGDQLAVGEGNVVKLLHAKTGECEKKLTGHRGDIDALRHLACKKKLLSQDMQMQARIWDITTRACERIINMNCRFSCIPHVHQYAVQDKSSCIQLYNNKNHMCEHTLQSKNKKYSFNGLYNSDGTQLAVAIDDGPIEIWDTNSGRLKYELHGRASFRKSLVFHSRKNLLAAESYFKSEQKWNENANVIWLWNTDTGNCEHVLEGHKDVVTKLVFHPTKDQLASGAIDKTIRIWDTNTGECKYVLEGSEHGPGHLMYHGYLDRLIAAFNDKVVIWNVSDEEVVNELKDSANSENILFLIQLKRKVDAKKSIDQKEIDTYCQGFPEAIKKVVHQNTNILTKK